MVGIRTSTAIGGSLAGRVLGGGGVHDRDLFLGHLAVDDPYDLNSTGPSLFPCSRVLTST